MFGEMYEFDEAADLSSDTQNDTTINSDDGMDVGMDVDDDVTGNNSGQNPNDSTSSNYQTAQDTSGSNDTFHTAQSGTESDFSTLFYEDTLFSSDFAFGNTSDNEEDDANNITGNDTQQANTDVPMQDATNDIPPGPGPSSSNQSNRAQGPAQNDRPSGSNQSNRQPGPSGSNQSSSTQNDSDSEPDDHDDDNEIGRPFSKIIYIYFLTVIHK